MSLPTDVRNELIDVLSDLDVFSNIAALRGLLKSALKDQPRGSNLIKGIRSGDALAMARQVVLECGDVQGPNGFLRPVLGQVLVHHLGDRALLTVNGALDHLEAGGLAASDDDPRIRAPDEDGPFVMMSYSHADQPAVRELVAKLTAGGVVVRWDQGAPKDTDWAVWVMSTYRFASHILIGCSEAYAKSEYDLLRRPNRAPSEGKGVAQEIRFMASEHMATGPGRFVPVMLPGASDAHIPLVAQGRTRFALPAQLDDLIGHLGARAPRSSKPSKSGGDATEDEPEPTPHDALRRRHIQAWKDGPSKRHERFIQLELAPQGEEGFGAPRTIESLPRLMATTPQAAVLLVGAPGAGKTTLLHHLRFELAEADLGDGGDRERVVFLLPLNEYPKKDPPSLGEWFAQRFERDMPGLGSLSDALARGQVWLLLDGLNEMAYGDAATDRFDDLRDELQALPPGNRVILTCREQDVAGELGDAARAEVKPLSPEDVEEFLGKYAPEKAAVAWADLQAKDLLGLYQNPYRLSLLVDELLEGGEVPNNRAALFSSLIRRTLKNDLRHRDADQWLTPHVGGKAKLALGKGQLPAAHTTERSQGALLIALAELAFEWQVAGPGEHRWWATDEALGCLGPGDPERAEALLKAGRAILALEEDDATERVRFPHQQLQEYFAARHWVRTLDERAFEQAAKGERVGDPKLGEPLAAVVAGLKPSAKLPERLPTGWEETAVMAVALAPDDRLLRRLADLDLVTAGRAALADGSGVSAEMKDGLRGRLGAFLRDPEVEPRARIDAGMVLDDPVAIGFQRRRSPDRIEYLLPPTGIVAAGTYELGSDDDDPDAFARERPRYELVLERDLVVARYPVTNAEFACFRAAGGYDDARWWPEGEARSWWKQEREDTQAEDQAKAIRGLPDAQLQELAASRGWSDDVLAVFRQVRAGSLEEAIRAFSPKVHPASLKRPEYWLDERYNQPLQPVVGLSVFEAEAYALWLADVSDRPVQLLEEGAWEAAARGGARRRWAFGDAPDPLAANTLDLRLRQTSPVGAFDPHEAPGGLSDLSGNTWEWTRSSWTASHKPTEASESARRVVRGGSWGYPMTGARGASRSGYPLDIRGNILGFRVCFPSPQSET